MRKLEKEREREVLESSRKLRKKRSGWNLRGVSVWWTKCKRKKKKKKRKEEAYG